MAERRNLLIVVDMQNHFITGALGTPQAQAILPLVAKKIKEHQGPVLFTRDSHLEDYLRTQEGQKLPLPHCIQGTPGWEIHADLTGLVDMRVVDKPSFGSLELAQTVQGMHKQQPLSSITLVGLCTDICVISNALILKAALPEIPVSVDAACCAGATPQGHQTALSAMKACQISIDNEATGHQPA